MQITEVTARPVDRRVRIMELAAAAPGLLLLLAAACAFAAALFGEGPLWPTSALTLAEAAALHDDADVLRLIGGGADPNAASAVRPELLTHETIQLAPLEAATGARQARTFQLLLERGATVDDSNWTRLICFASRLEADEIVMILNARQPGRPAPACAGVAIPFEP